METTVSRHTNQSTPTPILRLCKSLANLSTAAMWKSGIAIARSGALRTQKIQNDHFARGGVRERLRGQTPDEGLNRRPRLLTASAEGASFKKSAMAHPSSPSLMGEAGVRNWPTPKPRTISS
jgi:hypothetical protein